MPRGQLIQPRRGDAATWTSQNPTLAEGELGLELDTGKFKWGDGSTAWNDLAYIGGGSAPALTVVALTGPTTHSAVDGEFIIADVTSGDVVVNLPSPVAGAKVTVKRVGTPDFNTNAVLVQQGGD